MFILLTILLFFIAGLFGWLCADVWDALYRSDNYQKRWLGPVILVVGLLYMCLTIWNIDYSWQHKKYDADKYNIVIERTITEKDGQIDTTATFKIIKR